VVGDPGSGKSTFLNHVAHRLCGELLGAAPQAADAAPGLAGHPFPALIPLAYLWQHIESARGQGKGPTTLQSPAWLPHYLAAQCAEKEIELKEGFFRAQLKRGPVLLLLDGLDEAPSAQSRAHLVTLIGEAAQAYDPCRFVVTTRPAAYIDDAVLPGFAEARIDELEEEAIATFLKRWCEWLFPSSPREVQPYFDELRAAVRGTPEIRRMSRNPVMLTALAVVHRQEKQLPEQRADLYESIVEQLAKARKMKPGRMLLERCTVLLQNLALAMQDHPKGRERQVTRDWAARAIAPAFREVPTEDRVPRAEQFLQEEELDSGIVVGRGEHHIQFWHLTFQEYLAARALAGRDERRRKFLGGDQLFQPEWREVALLLAGVLYRRDPEGVDGIVAAVLDRLGRRPSLADQARVAGLLGACVRDLTPVHYKPADPRYQQTLDAVLGIFHAAKARGIDFRVRLEAAEALGQAGDPRLKENNWIRIERGTFQMGTQKTDPARPNYDARAYDNESPVHRVHLDAYAIGRYPVTVQELRQFVEDEEGYRGERWWQAGGFGKTTEPENWDEQVLHPNRPVVGVSWYEAVAYCAWLSGRLQREVRLPTEAEWERAARATTGRKYPWGNEEPDSERANYSPGNVRHPTPVGLYPRGATPEGIDDMAGNVWEWVADWYGAYEKAPPKNPKGPEQGAARVVRGGSWFNNPNDARAAYRFNLNPDGRLNIIGFRVVGVVPS
jgi:formylglycine-generating enzyme required for sulfatase activity